MLQNLSVSHAATWLQKQAVDFPSFINHHVAITSWKHQFIETSEPSIEQHILDTNAGKHLSQAATDL
jgi:hypothetical protein